METAERLTLIDLAHVLFASPLQELDRPTPTQVRDTVSRELCACEDDCSRCVGYVAQEAGDHPEEYRRRMRWALTTVQQVFEPAIRQAS
jgi:hypothetical protein